MVKISEMNVNTENKFKVVIMGLIFSFLFAITFYIIKPFNISSFIKLEKIYIILTLPIIVIITSVIHESIHILAFKLCSKGKAIIKIRIEKKLGSIMIQQTNNDLFYSKREAIIILLAPVIIITGISLVAMNYFLSYQLIIYTNCVLDAIGSIVDIYVSAKLIFEYNKKIMVSYIGGENPGMEVYEND